MCRMLLHGLRPEPADALRAQRLGVDPEAVAQDGREGGHVVEDLPLAAAGPVDEQGPGAERHDAVVARLLDDERLHEARVG
jgi:hypothetical protein